VEAGGASPSEEDGEDGLRSLDRVKWGYYNVLDDGDSRLRHETSSGNAMNVALAGCTCAKLARGEPAGQQARSNFAASKSSPPPGQSFFFPRCVIGVQLSTFLFPRPDLGQVPFLFYSSPWHPSQTARSLTSRTLSISLKLEYTSSRRDSEMAERNQNLPRTLCE
jgi:hypothetical protein